MKMEWLLSFKPSNPRIGLLTWCIIDRRMEQPQQELIDHYCELNKRDRSKWGDVKLNAALWPYVLSRTGTGE